MLKQILKVTIFFGGIAVMLGLIYAFAIDRLQSPAMTMAFACLIAAALVVPIGTILDLVTKREPAPVSSNNPRRASTGGQLAIFGMHKPKRFEEGDAVQFRTKKGRNLRTGKVVAIDHRRGYPRMKVMMTSIPGNRATLLRRPEELELLSA